MTKLKKTLIILFFLSLGFGRYYINFYFAIKPYMIVSVLMFLYNIIHKKSFKFSVNKIEKKYLFFIATILISLVHIKYIESILIHIIRLILLLVIYVNAKVFLNDTEKKDILDSIKKAGIIIAVINIVFYIYSIAKVGFTAHGNNIMIDALLLDRNYSRFIGTFDTDPNISCVYMSIFFAYFLSLKKWDICKIFGVSCYGFLIIATLSRGGILALLLLFVTTLLTSEKNKLRIILSILLALIILTFIANTFNINLFDSIMQRFKTDDNGSGRVELWKNALITYINHPISGIGINATLEYNLPVYGTNHYIHNTYLEVLSELGTIGFIAFATLLISIILFSYKLFRQEKETYIFYLFILYCAQMMFLSVLLSETFIIILLLVDVYFKNIYEEVNKNKRAII